MFLFLFVFFKQVFGVREEDAEDRLRWKQIIHCERKIQKKKTTMFVQQNI